jgi:hypothetical protein
MRGWYLTSSHFNRPRPTRHILLRHRAGAREWRRLLNRRLPEGIAKSIAVRIPSAPPLFPLLGPSLVAWGFLDPALNRSGTIETTRRCISR